MVLKKIFFLSLLYVAVIFFSLSSFAQNFPPVTINNNSKYSNSEDGKVELRLYMPQAEEMIISDHSDFTSAIWEKYSALKSFSFDLQDGLKTVYVKFKDHSNRESSVYSASIFFDHKPPDSLEITLNSNSKFCNHPLKHVTVNLKAQGADFMIISNDSTFQGGRWMPYTQQLDDWTLPGNDGEKKVYVKFKDQAGNESAIISDEIILDRVPPSLVSFKINEGARITNVTSVKLSIQAVDAFEVLLKEAQSSWKPFKADQDFYLEGEDGVKIISLRLRDEAGNTSITYNEQITLDRNPPKYPRILINNGTPYTVDPNRKVQIKLYAQEATEVMVSEDSSFKGASWESYKTTINWVLSEEDGEKNIFAKFKDAAGNITTIVKDEIVLDRSSPTKGSVTINKGQSITNSIHVSLQLQASDAIQMMVANNESFIGALWEQYIPEKKVTLFGQDGEKWFFVKYKDRAGNISKSTSASILLDRLPPTEIGLKINHGIGYSTDADARVLLDIKAKGASEMMISNTSDFKQSEWQAYQPSVTWQLEGEDGMKVVGIRFKDEAGNLSKVVTARIRLARSAKVSGGFNINSDSLYTKNPLRKVDLNIQAQGAKEMMISNFPDFNEGVWESFTTHKIWGLTEGDGEKTVYLKFKGFVGNESEVYAHKIILDRVPPQGGKIAINNDSLFTISKKNQVNLSIYASEAVEMMLSNNPVFNAARWEPYKRSKAWTLDKGEGIKNVYVKFKDRIGNETDVISDRILLDTTPPENVGLKINNGAEFTNNPRKAVTLVFVQVGATEMRINNSPAIESVAWEKISNKKLNWILPGEDGEKTVYVQYRDESKNESKVVFDKIILDRTPPINCSFTVNNDSLYTRNSSSDVRLYISGEEVNSILISNRRDFFGARWENFKKYKAHWILDGEDGEKTIFMLFKDAAGNIFSDTVEHKIILDRMPPEGLTVSIKGDDDLLPGKVINLHIKGSAYKMAITGRKDVPGNWEDFEENKEWMVQELGDERNIWVRFMDEAGNVSDFYEVFKNQ